MSLKQDESNANALSPSTDSTSTDSTAPNDANGNANGNSSGDANDVPTGESDRKRGRAGFFVALLVFVVAAPIIGFTWWPQPADTGPVSKPTVVDTEQTGTQAATLDDALEVARAGLARMEAELIDYTGRMVKRELVGRTLGPETELNFKIRTRRKGDLEGVQPQSMAVYLSFKSPESMNGREVIWVEDRNAGKLVAHDTGLAALIKISLDPKGFLAMQGNRYPLTEIGFKNLVRQLLVRSEIVRREGGAEVTFVDSFQVGDRDCLLIQVRPKATNGEIKPDTKLDFSLAEIAIDKERQIPLRYVAYGIAREGETSPPLLEEYTYYEVELNVGLTDQDFNVENPEYDFP